ncbi:MAG: hypothetical protein JNN20_12310 [Betaproteobacteria bacterium]|nr:hypothetical protein [Betaproteobacteria bacterium]
MKRSTRSSIRLFCFIAALLTGLLPASAIAQSSTNWSDHWYNANESGWGVTVTDHDTNAFVVYYTYAGDGHNIWFTIPGGTFSANRCVFSGAMYQTTGPGYQQTTFNPALVAIVPAGTGSIDFCPAAAPAGTAVFSYTLNNITQTKTIQRLSYGNAPVSLTNDYTDLWWNPAESGWGMNITQKGNNMFVAWYGYDTNGRPLFATMPGGTFSDARTFTSRFYTTTGPWFGSTPFDSSRVAAQDVGSAELNFLNRDNATFTFTIRGVTQTKNITRQRFGGDVSRSAATKYVATAGSDSNGDGTIAKPWRTIRHGISRLAGGETLIVRNGVYEGKDNFIDNVPSGTSTRQTVIMAEAPMEVRIRSSSSLLYYDNQLNLAGNYITIDGFIFDMAGTEYPEYIGNIDGNFNKVTRSIFKRSGDIDRYGGLFYMSGNDNLVEDVAGSGACRYCFAQGGPTSATQRNIWRRVVGRMDYSSSNQPKATFASYGNDDSPVMRDHLYQNVIAIDGQNPTGLGGEEKYGGFYTPKIATNVRLQGSIVLNEAVTYAGLFLREFNSLNSASHSVIWDLPNSASFTIGIKADRADHLTIGGIIPSAATDLNNDATSSLIKPATRPSNLLNNTPGAVIIKRYGVSGTRWGEPGFDQLTNEDLWPWPYQDKIKAVFREVNDPPSGNRPTGNNTRRGFAADGNGLTGRPITLTSYIWEYLGTPCPATYCP